MGKFMKNCHDNKVYFSSSCQSSVLPRDSLSEGGHTEIPLFSRQQEARGWPSSQVLPPIQITGHEDEFWWEPGDLEIIKINQLLTCRTQSCNIQHCGEFPLPDLEGFF